MKKNLLFILFCFFIQLSCYSQAFFTSNTSGNWDSTSTWVLVSGTSTSNVPVAGDSVIIRNGHVISIEANSQCQSLTVNTAGSLEMNGNAAALNVSNDLLVTAASNLIQNDGTLTITGNLTINTGSTITQNGGIATVIGLIFITAPTSNGNTLLDCNDGIFSCVGGLFINGSFGSRTAELRIGSGLVNVVGAITSFFSTGKINFSSNGTLLIAGLVTILNPSSFTAGNGQVVYVGIPGTDQAVASLTYNRLVITGIGVGTKTISGTVNVTDSLTLLTDTLLINGSGRLRMSNNATIVRTAGKILDAPTFLGNIKLVYNNIFRDTTGLEMPTSNNVLTDLTINNFGGVVLGSNVTVNNQLILSLGELATNNYNFTINNPNGGVGDDPAVSRTFGYVNGTINRSIGTTTGLRIFPFGIGGILGYRAYDIDYTTAPSVAGILTVKHVDSSAPSQSGLPLLDGAVNIVNTAPYYWQADEQSGLSGGTYTLTLTAEGTLGAFQLSTLRIIKRPSSGGNWTLDGIAGVNSGSIIAPVVVRNNMSGFSQFTIGGNIFNPLPLQLISFTGKSLQDGNELLWKTIQETDVQSFSIERSLDGISYGNIGLKTALNTNSINDYRFVDADGKSRSYFYRLRINDNNGSYRYSPVVYISRQANSGLQVFPNLVQDHIIIQSAPGSIIYLYNSVGQVLSRLVVGYNSMSKWASGIYYIKTKDQTLRIVKP